MMRGAFARSSVLKGPGRSDVELAMSKWWTKKRPAEGQVRVILQKIKKRKRKNGMEWTEERKNRTVWQRTLLHTRFLRVHRLTDFFCLLLYCHDNNNDS
jgi:hypothetical protein